MTASELDFQDKESIEKISVDFSVKF